MLVCVSLECDHNSARFLENGCECKHLMGTPCSAQFERDHNEEVWPKLSANLVVVVQIMALLSRSDCSNKTRTKIVFLMADYL